VSALVAVGVMAWRFIRLKNKPEQLYAQRIAQKEENEEA